MQQALDTEEGHFASMTDFSFVLREPPAQLPELDRIVNLVIAEVLHNCLLAQHGCADARVQMTAARSYAPSYASQPVHSLHGRGLKMTSLQTCQYVHTMFVKTND